MKYTEERAYVIKALHYLYYGLINLLLLGSMMGFDTHHLQISKQKLIQYFLNDSFKEDLDHSIFIWSRSI